MALQVRAIAKAEQSFRKADDALAKDLGSAMRTLRAASLAKKGASGGGGGGAADGAAADGALSGLRSLVGGGGGGAKLVRSLQDRRMANELAFLASLSATLTPEQASLVHYMLHHIVHCTVHCIAHHTVQSTVHCSRPNRPRASAPRSSPQAPSSRPTSRAAAAPRPSRASPTPRPPRAPPPSTYTCSRSSAT